MDISQAAKLLTLKVTEPQQRAALKLLLEELDAEVRTPPALPTDKATTLARWMVFFWEGMNTATVNAYCPNTDGAVEHVEHYVNILSDFYDQAIEQYNSLDHTGVYEYEVLEELGRWAALRSHEHREMIDATTLLNEAQNRHREFFIP